MDHKRQFQLYLLATMRVDQSFLKASLERLSTAEAELLSARETMIALGVEAVGIEGGFYRRILGPPVSVRQIDSDLIPDAFRGSSELVFKLDLWPDLDFEVREYANGQDGRPAFKRPLDLEAPLLNSFIDLAHWKFVKSEVTKRFGKPESGDGWDYWEELYYMIPMAQGEDPRKCFLVFDYDLLQSFEIA